MLSFALTCIVEELLLVMPSSLRSIMSCTVSLSSQSLGYQGEIGYQTFLYSSMKEWRKLLMFLLEKLPKDTAQAADEPMGAWVGENRGGKGRGGSGEEENRKWKGREGEGTGSGEKWEGRKQEVERSGRGGKSRDGE